MTLPTDPDCTADGPAAHNRAAVDRKTPGQQTRAITPAAGAILLLALAGLAACAGSPAPPEKREAATRQITAASQCGFVEPGLVYMDSRQRLEEVTGARGVNLTAMSDHDFSREHLLLIATGRKPSGGYGLSLEKGWLQGDVLELAMTLRSPSPDQMVTQALTSPCAVVAVSPEHWQTVRVTGTGLPELSLER